MLARQPDHGRVQVPVARHYLPAFAADKLSPSVVRDLPARLLQDQAPGGYIRRRLAALVVAVQPARGHVAQIQRRGDQAPHASGDRREAPEQRKGLLQPGLAVGEAGRDQRPGGLVGVRYPYGLAVAGCALFALGDVSLFPHRVEYHTQDHLARLLEGYGDAEDGESVGVVGGAVQGIDDPTGILLAPPLATLLRQHSVGGEGAEKDLSYRSLCLLVHLRDELRPLVPDGVPQAEAFAQHLARFPRRRECRLEFVSQVLDLPWGASSVRGTSTHGGSPRNACPRRYPCRRPGGPRSWASPSRRLRRSSIRGLRSSHSSLYDAAWPSPDAKRSGQQVSGIRLCTALTVDSPRGSRSSGSKNRCRSLRGGAHRDERVVLLALDGPRHERCGQPHLLEQTKPRGTRDQALQVDVVGDAHPTVGFVKQERVMHGVGSLAGLRRQRPLQVARPPSALVLTAAVLSGLG